MSSTMERRLPRAMILLRQRRREAEQSGDWQSYDLQQEARRAARVTARLTSLTAQLPRALRVERAPTINHPQMVRVSTPGGQSLDWDPTHNQVWSGGRSYHLPPAGIARVMAGVLADERAGICG